MVLSIVSEGAGKSKSLVINVQGYWQVKNEASVHAYTALFFFACNSSYVK
jgi:hypothetical protein